MTRIEVRVEGHYEVHETPSARSYEWHPEYLTLVCDCGAESTSYRTGSTLPACRCGANLDDLVEGIRAREGQLRDEIAHPRRYDDVASPHTNDE